MWILRRPSERYAFGMAEEEESMIESLTVAVAFMVVAGVVTACLWPSFADLTANTANAGVVGKSAPPRAGTSTQTPAADVRSFPAPATLALAQQAVNQRGDGNRTPRH
jgi:hypothetical protein